jgi:hypothetical protein
MKAKLRRPIASLLIVSMTGCAVPLVHEDRVSLSSQPKIHSVHHRPAAGFVVREPTVVAAPTDTPANPTVGERSRLQRVLPEDPAPRVKSRLVGALQANLNLTNVHTVPSPLENDDVNTLKDAFETGVVLDVRTMKWGGDDSRVSYYARARMVRLEDSTVLWKAACSARSANGEGSLEVNLLKAADDCAAQLSARLLGKKYMPVSVAGHAVPVEGLPNAPQIVLDVGPIELAGIEMTPEERAQFEERRAARIARHTEMESGRMVVGMLDPRCLVLLPVCFVALGAAGAAAHSRASAREPSLIPEENGARLASLLKKHATGVSLATRILRSFEFASVSAAVEAGSPRLVVRMKAARLEYVGTRIRVTIVAQAQAFPSTGARWEPTEHRYEFPSRAWTTNDAELVRREIDGALDALAESISWTYLSKLPTNLSAEEAGSQ